MSTSPEITVEIPEGVQVAYADKMLSVKGPKGEVKKRLFFPGLKIVIDAKTVKITQKTGSRRFKRVNRTFESHVKNMITGVTEGWTAELKVVYSHFPMTVKVEGDLFKVTNFIGGSHPKTTKILPEVKVTAKGKDITIEGVDIEKVGQMAADIEKLTRLTGIDRRKFLDGIFITKKPKDE